MTRWECGACGLDPVPAGSALPRGLGRCRPGAVGAASRVEGQAQCGLALKGSRAQSGLCPAWGPPCSGKGPGTQSRLSSAERFNSPTCLCGKCAECPFFLLIRAIAASDGSIGLGARHPRLLAAAAALVSRGLALIKGPPRARSQEVAAACCRWPGGEDPLE